MKNEQERRYAHPLFLSGVIPLSTPTSQGNTEFSGYYNPVVDSIFLLNPHDEVFQHEVTHRVFSTFGASFAILRMLAGISHALLFALIDILNQQGIQLAGTDFATLQARHSRRRPSSELIDPIVSQLRAVEALWNACFWSIVPVAEIAAIDFVPPKGADGWYVKKLRDDEEVRKRKAELIDATADWLAQESLNFPGQIHDDIHTEFHEAWKAYTSIEDNEARGLLLQLVLSSSIELNPASASSFITTRDSLRLTCELAPRAQQPGAVDLFQEKCLERTTEIFQNLGKLIEQMLTNISEEYYGPINIAYMIQSLLLYSHPFPLNPVLPQLQVQENEDAKGPGNSLLAIWMDSSGRPQARVSARCLLIAEILAKEKPPLSLGMQPFLREWWRFIAGFETLRQAMRKGVAVICPFLGLEGITCNEECPIREMIGILQGHTKIKGKACPVQSKEKL